LRADYSQNILLTFLRGAGSYVLQWVTL
jgi:hypothetical protein